MYTSRVVYIKYMKKENILHIVLNVTFFLICAFVQLNLRNGQTDLNEVFIYCGDLPFISIDS